MADTFFSMFTPEEIARISAPGTPRHAARGLGADLGADRRRQGLHHPRRHGVGARARRRVAQLGPGDIVGEAAIVNHSLRTATIVALTPLELIHFTDERWTS